MLSSCVWWETGEIQKDYKQEKNIDAVSNQNQNKQLSLTLLFTNTDNWDCGQYESSTCPYSYQITKSKIMIIFRVESININT